MRVLALDFFHDINTSAIAEACFRITPQIAVGKDSIFLEIGRCQKLYSEDSVKKRVSSILKSFGVVARMACADDIPTALSFARYGGNCKWDLPIESLNEYLDPIYQENRLDDMVENLRRLGIYCIGEMESVSRKELASRFGREGFEAYMAVRNGYRQPWPHFTPEDLISETKDVESLFVIKDVEPLFFILKGLVDKVSKRLFGRGEKAVSMELRIDQESYSTVKDSRRCYNITFSMPQRSTATILGILREFIAKKIQEKPLESEILFVELTVTRTVKGQYAQKDLLDRKEEEKEEVASLVNRLCQRLGPHKAFLTQPRSSYKPEANWLKTLEQGPCSSSDLPPRPLRLLKSPRRLTYQSGQFVSQGQCFQVQKIQGPENISGEWWDKPFNRDYYRVTTHNNMKLWIYREDKQYYLQGFFD